MKKGICIDCSGALPEDLQQRVIRDVYKPGDVVFYFSHDVHGDSPLPPVKGVGGADARPAVRLAHQRGCDCLVLVSDGEIDPDQIALFDHFIQVRP